MDPPIFQPASLTLAAPPFWSPYPREPPPNARGAIEVGSPAPGAARSVSSRSSGASPSFGPRSRARRRRRPGAPGVFCARARTRGPRETPHGRGGRENGGGGGAKPFFFPSGTGTCLSGRCLVAWFSLFLRNCLAGVSSLARGRVPQETHVFFGRENDTECQHQKSNDGQ